VIAVVGQSVIDRVRSPDGSEVERLGGSPVFAAAALAFAGRTGVILTKGATAELRAPLAAFGLPVAVGEATASFVSELEVFGDGERRHRIASFGEPFRPDEVTGWMAPHLATGGAVVCGAQWRDDFPGATLRALAADGRTVLLDAQGPTRPARLGAVVDEGPLDPEWVAGVTVLKCSEQEADALFGDAPPGAAGIPVVVVTRGLAGAVVHLPDGVAEVAGDPVRGLADAIGAGDTFMTLMAVALLDGADPVAAATAACAGTSALLRRRLDPSA
jgi:sugar/nucleoside kinase (ribokinase family)